MKKAIWLAFDFGLKGDYNGLYTWLDNHEALDCGQGLAFLTVNAGKEASSQQIKNQVLRDLKQSVKLSKSDRIYIIFKESTSNKIKGDFISGSRKAAPWEGYGRLKQQIGDDEGE